MMAVSTELLSLLSQEFMQAISHTPVEEYDTS